MRQLAKYELNLAFREISAVAQSIDLIGNIDTRNSGVLEVGLEVLTQLSCHNLLAREETLGRFGTYGFAHFVARTPSPSINSARAHGQLLRIVKNNAAAQLL
jgi:hypothetical protein